MLTTDKFFLELRLREPGFTYSACVTFTKHHEKIKKFREPSDLKHIYKNQLEKVCFVYDAGYFDNNDLAKRTISDTVLKDKSYEIAINSKYGGYKKGLAIMVDNIFRQKTSIRSECKLRVGSRITQTSH